MSSLRISRRAMRNFRIAWLYGREQRKRPFSLDPVEVWDFAIDNFKPKSKKSVAYVEFWGFLKGYRYRNLL